MDVTIGAMQPVLETRRLDLRPLRKDDTGLISLYTSDIRVARMTARIPHPNPPGAVEAFIDSVARPGAAETTWAIDATRGFGTPLVGLASLGDDGELGYWVAPFFWRLGIASEAVAAVIGYAKSRGDSRVWASAFEDNPASQAVLAKAGLGRSGVGTIHSVCRGENVSCVYFERELSKYPR